jgi:hypothetical protein
MAALLFIDTNIYLDFYRRQGSGTSLSMLRHFDGNFSRIIVTSQVEMEYKKNRQGVILKSVNSIKRPDDVSDIIVPDYLRESRLNQSLKNTRAQLLKRIDQLKEKTSKLLDDPNRYDPVFKVLQRLFKAKEECHLYRTRERKLVEEIRALANKRFMLGYPPRKESDTSIGDAINWEWIIHCAKNCSKDIVIVSRDSDYGVVSNKEAILNDWLRQEFKERAGANATLVLTNLLTEGFKRASIQVTQQEEAEEQKHVEQTRTTDMFAKAYSTFTDPGQASLSSEVLAALSGLSPNIPPVVISSSYSSTELPSVSYYNGSNPPPSSLSNISNPATPDQTPRNLPPTPQPDQPN